MQCKKLQGGQIHKTECH